MHTLWLFENYYLFVTCKVGGGGGADGSPSTIYNTSGDFGLKNALNKATSQNSRKCTMGYVPLTMLLCLYYPWKAKGFPENSVQGQENT